MAAWLNKWLVLTVSPLFLLLSGHLPYSPDSGRRPELLPHPFHVSVTEITHNAPDKTLEISCKIFTDDFEKVLAKNYKTKVDLINPPNKAAMDSLVKKYIFSHLSIKANGRPVQFSYLGFENDHEAAYGYIEVSNIPSLTRLDISTSVMYDMFEDQMNIFHVIVNGNRKSTKLNYPDKEAVLSF
jgi:hypothetical protein